ncbi:MAG TPA: sulfotransferase [Caulobacteraceae bacterium]|nr:sulfotransferase [Caulobacteraceae bacterium]
MDSPAATSPSSTVEPELRRLRALQRDGRHDEALLGVEALLADWPLNRDLLLLKAISERHLLRIDDALATLEGVEALHPRFSRLFEERGLCRVVQKDAPRAIDALLRAVNINPALPMSWRMLEGLYRMTGEPQHAATAAAHMAALKGLPREVVTATSLFSDGEIDRAEQLVRAFLIRHGDHPEGMRLLARIGMARDVLDDAELLLEAALVIAPDYQAARYDYADVLARRHKYARAKEEIERLLSGAPGNADYLALAATAAVGLGDNDAAIAIYRDLLAQAPASPDLNLWNGHALKTVGRLPEAIAAYHAAAAARPAFGDAWWSLANLKTYRFTDAEIERMRVEETAPATPPVDRYHLCFALGKALEDRGEAAASWTYYERGNALKRAESRYRPDILETNTRQQSEVCTPAFFAARQGWGDQRPDPIFVVGLPRSGSTLIEQILASHSAVEGTQELAEVQRIVLELQGREPDLDNPRYPGALQALSEADVAALGARYLAETADYRSGPPRFIDKNPNNFRHVGLIHLMLPNAKIIDVRREPMSCCFSNLKQLFAQGQEFSYSAEDIARYYRTYLDLMRHWGAALPGRVLLVQHEDVVDDLGGSVRRILDYCGLPFEPGCVEFHKTRRSVRTPSSEQVRQPIFRDGLDAWRKYEPWLGELRAALGDAVDRYRDQEPA